MKYRLAIFDFDGTLADSFGWFAGVFNDVADRYRFRRVRPSERETLRGYSARQLVRHLGVPRWKLPFIVRYIRRLMAQDVDQIRLFDGIEEALKDLAGRGLQLSVVSSNATETVRRVLGGGTAACIQYYACGASIFGKQKKLRAVLRRSGVRPDEAIYIGDEIRDIEAARMEGVVVAAVTWGYTSPDALRAAEPDAVFERVAEMSEMLLAP